MTAAIEKAVDRYIQQFTEALKAAGDALAEAARVYVEALDSGEVVREQFQERFPGFGHQMWNNLEAVGRGWMDRRLLTASGLYVNRVKSLPKSEQVQVLNEGVEVLSSDGSALTVKPENMTPDQVKQVFAGDHIRTLPEQRAYVESQAVHNPPMKPSTTPYEIRNNCLNVKEPTRFTRKQLAQILADMED